MSRTHWTEDQWNGQDDPPKRERRYTVTIFILDQAYGGPEEGGWWYETGAPTTDALKSYTRTFTSAEAAARYAEFLNRTIVEEWNEGRYPLSSVCCDGIYRAVWDKGTPKPFPSHRPHYE